MSDPVICVKNLSKKYTIGHQPERYKTLRDLLTTQIETLRNRLLVPGTIKYDRTSEEFWALKDVSFEIHQGDRVGIIGRNGSGKSTLLKILSRITEPTQGRVATQGRIASLLEVGTGFHPELTGRENIYLNGAILGMSKVEIRKKFDEIVDFAEVEKFLDTPVKRYSSGMYVRLAFAVAAHLEPEILIVDEVLAVGDTRFQKKCLGKMQEVGQAGRTILFVSHNMHAVQSLCDRCLILQEGCLIADQPSALAIYTYLQDTSASNTFIRPQQTNGKPTLIAGKLILIHHPTQPQVQIDVEIFTSEFKRVSLDLRLMDGTGLAIGFGSLGTLDSNQLLQLEPGLNHFSVLLATHQLAFGSYLISLDLTLPNHEFYDRAENCFAFEIVHSVLEESVRVMQQTWGYGSISIPLETVGQLKRNE